MERRVSKSAFKSQALKYLRDVERTGREIVITDRGTPVVKLVPFRPDPRTAREELLGTVVRYEDPTEPVGVEDWEALW
jgi:prevent-host-death family protein